MPSSRNKPVFPIDPYTLIEAHHIHGPACMGASAAVSARSTAHAIEFMPETKRIRIYVTQYLFCSQCNDVCPTNSLSMSPEFLLACEDRYAESQIIE